MDIDASVGRIFERGQGCRVKRKVNEPMIKLQEELNDWARIDVRTNRCCPISGTQIAWVVSVKDRHGLPLRNVCWSQSGFIGVDPIPIADVSEFYKNGYRQQYNTKYY